MVSGPQRLATGVHQGLTLMPGAGSRVSFGVLGAVALGGVVGSLGRYAVGVALPHAVGGFPWPTLVVNVTGAFAMGLLVAFLVDRPGVHRLARPFVGLDGGKASWDGSVRKWSAVLRWSLGRDPLVNRYYPVHGQPSYLA